MKSVSFLLSVVFLSGVFGLSAAPAWADGILFKVRLGDSNYCHMKFPAIREGTLGSNRPVLKDPSSGDIIDFYGPCDHDPLGKTEVRAQRHYRQRMDSRDGE